MFEKVVIHRSVEGPAVSIGDIAEALLFYQSVHLVLDYASLSGLIDAIDMVGVLSLLARDNVSAVYVEEMLATHTRTATNGQEFHGFCAITVGGDRSSPRQKSKKERLAYLLQRKGHHRGDALRLAERFFNVVPFKTLSSDYFIKGGIPEAARADLDDSNYVLEAVRQYGSATGVEEIENADRVGIDQTEVGFRILSNLDFKALNSRRTARDLSVGQISEASALCPILDARAAIVLASHYGGEFVTSDRISKIVRMRYGELLKRTGISTEELRVLHDVTLPEYPHVREVINSGSRSFDEFLLLLDKSRKFRSWIKSVNPDAKLAHEYLKSITADSWFAKFPVKSVRYALTTAVSMVHPGIGAALSAGDSLLLDKLVRGWRPSHFVEGHLRPFLGKEKA